MLPGTQNFRNLFCTHLQTNWCFHNDKKFLIFHFPYINSRFRVVRNILNMKKKKSEMSEKVGSQSVIWRRQMGQFKKISCYVQISHTLASAVYFHRLPKTRGNANVTIRTLYIAFLPPILSSVMLIFFLDISQKLRKHIQKLQNIWSPKFRICFSVAETNINTL